MVEIDGGQYVQVRYSREERWVAVDVAEYRRDAAWAAGRVFVASTNPVAVIPLQVRIASAAKLLDEGGQEAVNRAAADLWQRPLPT
jgi:hypothetical protein